MSLQIININTINTISQIRAVGSPQPSKDLTLDPVYWDQKIIEIVEKALDSFLLETEDGAMYIQDPSSGLQIVSEAMGYWMTIFENLNSIFGSHYKFKGKTPQEYFNGLLKGVLKMMELNINGLPSWQVYYNAGEKKIMIYDRQNHHSATDADLYITRALIHAQALVDAKEEGWLVPRDPKTGMEDKDLYRNTAIKLLERIKGCEIVKTPKRNVITVSDGWGRKDIKGAISINPSYSVYSALLDIAEFDKQDKDFWMKVIEDNFEIAKEAQKTATALLEGLANGSNLIGKNENGTLKVDGTHAYILNNIYKKTTGKYLYIDEKGEIIDPTMASSNEDGSYNFDPAFFKNAIDQCKNSIFWKFIPDQAEVYVNNDGSFEIRFEKEYGNLLFTEGFDAIRVYKEIGELLLLLLNGNKIPDFLYNKFQTFGGDSIVGKLPEKVKSGEIFERKEGKHNIVAAASYFMLSAGLRDKYYFNEHEKYMRMMCEGNYEGIFDPTKIGEKTGIPRYFYASIALLTLTSLRRKGAGKEELEIMPVKLIKRVLPKPVPEEEETLPLASPHGIDAGAKYIWAFYRPTLDPMYPTVGDVRASSSLGRQQFTPNNAFMDKTAAMSLKEYGAYKAARENFFKAIIESSYPKDKDSIIDALNNFVNIEETIAISGEVILDDLRFILKHFGNNEEKSLFIKYAIARKMNQIGKSTEAFLECKNILEYFANYFEKRKITDM